MPFSGRAIAGCLLASLMFLGMLFASGAQAANPMVWPYQGQQTNNDLIFIAGNQQTGDVLGFGDNSIFQFDADGNPKAFTAPGLAGSSHIQTSTLSPGFSLDRYSSMIAVDNSGTATQGNFYVSTTGSLTSFGVVGFDASGEQVFRILGDTSGTHDRSQCGVSVDNEGDVWVGHSDVIVEYSAADSTPTGQVLQRPSTLPPFSFFCNVQFDGEGNAYVLARMSDGAVYKLDSDGNVIRTIRVGAASILLDPRTENLLVLVKHGDVGQQRLEQYSPDGELLSVHGAEAGIPQSDTTGGIALGPNSTNLRWFSNGQLARFGPGALRPEAEVEDVSTRAAELSGTVYPDGSPTTYQFEYGSTQNLGNTAPSVPADAGSGTGPAAVTGSLTGLAPLTYYYVRLVAYANAASYPGPIQRIRTRGVHSEMAEITDISQHSATLRGSVDAFDLVGARYRVVINSKDSAFSLATAWLDVPASSGPVSIAVPVTGLPAGEQFSASIVGIAEGTSHPSEPREFSTLSPLPARHSSPTGCGIKCAVPAASAGNPLTLAVRRGKTHGARTALVVTTSGSGQLTAKGRLLRKARIDVAEAGSQRLHLKLSKAGARALRKRGKVRTTAWIRFKASDGTSLTQKVTVRFNSGGNR